MRVLVCGGRDFTDQALLEARLGGVRFIDEDETDGPGVRLRKAR
jgi:hypothetical protein